MSVIVSYVRIGPQLKLRLDAVTLTGMFDRWKRYLPVGIIILFSFFLFRNYFLKGLVPFPANLLVATYEPWRSYPVPEYPNGPPNKPMGFDNIRIYYPLKKVAIDLVKHAKPPLWNPYNFTGNPILATYQSAIFHPLSFLYLLLPQIDAWSIIIILQPILAGLAMYAFLSALEFSMSACLLGALTFAFSGFFIVWWEEAFMFTYSALFLPIALTAVELFLKSRRRIWLAVFALSLAGSIVSGAFQMTFYVFLFTAAWITYRLWHEKKKWQFFGMFLGAGIIALLLGSVHLLPSMEAYYHSARISADAKYIFDAYLLPLTQLITLIAPDYFGNPGTYNYFGSGFYHERMMWFGVVPLFFVLMEFMHPSQKRHALFFRIAFLVTLSLVLALPTTWLLLYYLKLPLLSTLTPSRMMMLVTFSAAVLTAYGVETYWQGIQKRTLVITTLLLGASIAVAGFYPIYIHHLQPKLTMYYMVSLRNLVIPTASLGIIVITLFVSRVHKRLRPVGFAILTAVLLTGSVLFAQKFLYFSERRFIYPATPVLSELQKRAGFDRFWTYENGYIEKNFATYYGLFSPEGYDSITIRRYGELLSFADSHGASMTSSRSDALIQSTDHLNNILTDPYRKKLLELLDVRYILQRLLPDRSEKAVLPDPTQLPTVWKDNTYAIHEYKEALPHAALYSLVAVIPDGKTELTAMFDTTTDIHTRLFLEQKPEGLTLNPEATGTASITGIQPNSVSIRTQTTDAMMLFLSDAYYPGWNAYIDSVKTPVYRADYAFRAVAVPKGTHIVIFKYEPLSWKLGLILSSIGIVFLGFLVLTKNITQLKKK